MKIKLTVKLWYAYFIIVPFFGFKIISHYFFSGFSCEDYSFPLPTLFPGRTVQDPLIVEILFFLIFNFILGVVYFAYALPFTVLSLQMIYGKETYGKIQDQVIKFKYGGIIFIFLVTPFYYNLNYLLFC